MYFDFLVISSHDSNNVVMYACNTYVCICVRVCARCLCLHLFYAIYRWCSGWCYWAWCIDAVCPLYRRLLIERGNAYHFRVVASLIFPVIEMVAIQQRNAIDTCHYWLVSISRTRDSVILRTIRYARPHTRHSLH